MRLFQERGLPMSVFGCALALQRHPPAAKAICPPLDATHPYRASLNK